MTTNIENATQVEYSEQDDGKFFVRVTNKESNNFNFFDVSNINISSDLNMIIRADIRTRKIYFRTPQRCLLADNSKDNVTLNCGDALNI